MPLQEGDHILSCGQARARATMRHNLLGIAVPQAPEGKRLLEAPVIAQKPPLERQADGSVLDALPETK
jgi:voltage-gated potassium channel